MQPAKTTKIRMKSVFRYRHDLELKKTIFISINGLFSLINIIKTESNNLLCNHTQRNHGA